ncbi:MAG: type II toxin-antitoxin system RelE/ParE family toxin [Magnetococcales bacterium]|nr:type II toxin-antitoxin system RelE/ParE family toxin [Magnetococcales bacterium]
MIESFNHKGLEDLFYDGKRRGVPPHLARKLTDILDLLDAAIRVEDLSYPGSGLHPLKGNMKGMWAVRVTGNWRIVFEFEEGQARRVDLVDYH